MFTRSFHATVLAAGLIALAPLGSAVAQTPIQHTHQDVTILHLIETAQTQKDHEAVAKHFEAEAAQYDKQAADHEQLAKLYRRGFGVPPKGNAASFAPHCDSLAKNLKASAADARELAQLHRDLGKALAQ
jgi:hypothetical protein